LLLETNIRKMLVDGSQWASWQGYHIPASNEYFVVWTPAGTQMRWRPNTWISEKHQLSYFWRDAWYTIHIGYDQRTGEFLSGYCDVILPNNSYTNTDEQMIYTDLYIDVVVRDDYSVYTKDHEVFDRAALRYPIIERSRKPAFEVLDWLEEHARRWTGPFKQIPRQLPRTDFEVLIPDEAGAIVRAITEGDSNLS
jgi:protein associated with RNAse G/E